MPARKLRRQNYRYFDLSLLQSRRLTKRPPLNARLEVVLPREVHVGILAYLEALHRNPLAPTCDTCLMRDVSSYSKVCSEWHAAAVSQLYISIFSSYSPFSPTLPSPILSIGVVLADSLGMAGYTSVVLTPTK